ncbi:agamous-like MADS-box protein AGL61 [Triticum dicoccoides]|uniref:agamous-like MADS-box protein AGL61 n=1 Tax=Triticum dicoccoides TaxID=85692 RepID=UPI00189065A2|nr:agamous-like MADS-box protein AGL61 [Triticum dicoccoides]
MAPKRKGGNGRQKTIMRRVEKEGARQVCFAKRRQGLFNKANELAVMCGAEVAAISYSPGGNAFSFDHPSAEAVIDRFLAGGATGVLSATDNNKLKNLHLQHGELRTQLKEVKMRKECIEEAMAKKCVVGDQIAVWLNPKLGDMGEEEMMAFAAKLMPVRAAISECANQVLLDLGMENILRALQAPGVPLPQQLVGGSTFEFGSTSTNTRMEMQQMHMAMPPTRGFAIEMDMHHMPMAMPPPGLAYGMNMQQILMSIPPPSGFGAGMEMQQMVMVMSPQPEFVAGTEKQQVTMAMPLPEFPANVEMPPPMGIAAGTEMVQQATGTNMGFPY